MPPRPTLAALLALTLTPLTAIAAPLGARRDALIDGAPVTAGPAAAVGALLATADDGRSREGAYMCSAVLIAPRLALTAAHCVALVEADAAAEGWQLDWWLSFAPDVRGFDGPDPALPPHTLAVTAVDVHPGFAAAGPPRSDRLDAAHDLALLHLAEPAPVPAVPIARPAALAPTDDGVLIAGYGFEAPAAAAAPAGRRTAGPSRLIAIGPHELRVGRRAAHADPVTPGLAEKCGGDSGGATFLATDAGWRLIGLTSRAFAGDADCAIAGIDTRVDAHADWITARAAPDPATCHAAPGAPVPPPLLALLPLAALARRRRGLARPRQTKRATSHARKVSPRACSGSR